MYKWRISNSVSILVCAENVYKIFQVECYASFRCIIIYDDDICLAARVRVYVCERVISLSSFPGYTSGVADGHSSDSANAVLFLTPVILHPPDHCSVEVAERGHAVC